MKDPLWSCDASLTDPPDEPETPYGYVYDAIEEAITDLKGIAESMAEGVEAGEGLVWLVPTLDEALKAHDLVVSDRKDDLAAIKAVIADLEKAI